MNVGDYKGWTGLSPPTVYPSTVERETYSPVPSYPSTMLAYIETTQIPLGPLPYGSIGKGLGQPESMMNHHLDLALILLI
jgi:hypothetical protein